MSSESNKAVARIWFEQVITGRDLGAIDTAYAPTYVHRGPDGHTLDREAARGVAAQLLSASGDRRAVVIDQIAEGDTVVTRWESRGTRAGDAFIVHGIVISRLRDGRIVEDWEIVHHPEDPRTGS